MAPPIQKTWPVPIRFPISRQVAPGPEFFQPETKPKFRPVSPLRDQISKIVRRTGRVNAGLSRKVSGIRDSRDCLVAHAVQCEPVSTPPNSLLTGKRTGKFAFFDQGYGFRRPICVQVQRFSVEFPTQRNRELFRWSSELRSQIRDLPKPNKVRRAVNLSLTRPFAISSRIFEINIA